MTDQSDVYLGLGSNLGDREARLRAALRALQGVGAVVQVAPFYETTALYVTDQPDFLNTACLVTTDLEPFALLRRLQELERAAGRLPTRRYGERVIDVDILLFGDRTIASDVLTIPHPLLAERAFALAPLADLAPGLVHPVLKVTIARLLETAPGREGVRRYSSS